MTEFLMYNKIIQPTTKGTAMLKTVLKVILQYFRKLDKTLFIAVCGVSAFSVLMMYSIVRNGITSENHSNMYKIQFICL